MTLQWQDYVVSDPDICGGLPTMKGTRILLRQVLADVAANTPAAAIIAAYPSLKPERIEAAIAFAALQQDRS
ncbi:MAG: DUF433 domain-containing protein [Reyranella sp.]|jgi:uncharacterized protein (DUF433 family)|nr:DUF433 domain-containing protein [Reyranella sp.]